MYFLRWWLCLFALGVITLPFTMTVFKRFADRGYAFSKVLSLGILSLASFIFATIHLLPFRTWALLVLAALMVVAQVLWLVRDGKARDEVLDALGDPVFLRRLLVEEAVFLVSFAVWTWVRAQAPDLSSLEKPMDHGFIAAILDSTWMPAQDMWFSGGTINYYYFGQFFTAVLCRLTGISSAVGYNLMVATTFGLSVSTSSGLVFDLLHLRKHRAQGRIGRFAPAIGGAVGAGVICLGGNGHALIYRIILPALNRLGAISYTKNYWFADATRYINCFEGSTDATIHEFPFYSFVVADLHAHMLDICFVIVFLALAAAFLVRMREQRDEPFESFSLDAFPVQFVLMGVMLGIMSMTNYWDFAIYLVVSLFVVAYAALLKRDVRVSTFLFSLVRDMLVLYIISRFVALAFTLHFSMISSSIELVSQRSPFREWLVLWYPFLIFAALYLVVLFGYDKPARSGRGSSSRFLAWVRGFEVPDFLVFLMLLCAIGLLIFPELVYVKDIYATAPRANTMFKFTYQAFIMFGLAMGYGCVRVMDTARQRSRRGTVCVGIATALIIAIPFTFTSAGMSYALRTRTGTLNGLAYISKSDSGEAQMIEWIEENTSPDAVIVEANGNSYTEYDRISSSTGRPTILGWYVHEWLWRSRTTEENERIADIKTIYTSSDYALTREKLEEYGVSYVYVGARERQTFTDVDIVKLRALSTDEVDYGDATLFKVSTS